MEIALDDFVIKIIEKFEQAGFEIYIVGGAVRDILTNRPVYDWDFTTNATPEEILSLFPEEGFYDNKFGTVGISHESSPNPYEITTYRTEHGYSDARRPDRVEWGKNLNEDLNRRDFTINAMALKPKSAKQSKSGVYQVELVDPHNGQEDLDKKLIRAVGDPQKRFREDALRMMRAVRFAAELGLKIEENTFQAIQENADLINKIAKERIKVELMKIIASPNPYEGMMVLKDSGLMREILPELETTFGVEQKSPGRHHIYDVGTHSMLSLKHCPSKDPIVRFACLIHDIGKPQTFKRLDNGTITFYNHEVVGAKIARRIANKLRFSKKETQKLVKLVRWHQFTVDEDQSDKAIRRFIRRVGRENVEDMLDLRTGDRLGSGARETSWRTEEFKKRLIEVQKQPFSIKDLKITGNDVMEILDIEPGPKVGKVLEQIFEEVEDDKIPNERETLLKELINYK